MRDEQDRARKIGQLAFKPIEALEVEMVGRLVEQQNVWLGRQGARECGAGQLAPGERRQLAVHVAVFEAEATQDRLDVHAPAVATSLVERELRIRVGVHGGIRMVAASHRGLEFAERTLDSLDVAEQLGDIRTERATVRAWWSLVVQRNAPTLRNADLTAVGINFAGDDPQQRGLANAVASNQANSLAGANA